MFETLRERLAAGRPVGEDFRPLADDPALRDLVFPEGHSADGAEAYVPNRWGEGEGEGEGEGVGGGEGGGGEVEGVVAVGAGAEESREKAVAARGERCNIT
mgnify:CR=1 FL=1